MLECQKEFVLLCRCPTKYMQCRVYGMRTDIYMFKNKHSSLIQWTIAFSKKRNSSTFGLGCKTKQHKMVANIKCDADDAYNLLDMASRNEKIDTVPSIRSSVSYAKGYLLNIIDLSRKILVKC